MKILYAIQGTGNGHLARAMEIAPILDQKVQLDLLISGKTAELKFPLPFKYKYHGLYFFFGKKGGINYWKTLSQLKPYRLIKDSYICPVEDYDVVLNDFEPISAWAARRKKIPVIGLSHQASFFSDKVPLPKKRLKIFEFGMRKFAPVDEYIGLHYKSYDNHIYPPVIRQSLKKQMVSDKGHITVYLPAFSDSLLIRHFNKLSDRRWQIFSKKTNEAYESGNVQVFPINKAQYSESLLSAHALLIGGGFQGTSEGLYLNKRMLVIPMYDQYEQLCNAAALSELAVPVLYDVEDDFADKLRVWLESEYVVNYKVRPDTSALVDRILILAEKLMIRK